jgi:hypothetical protein
MYSTRSERMLTAQLDGSRLFRWFLGLNIDDAIRDAITFCKNRERRLAGEVAPDFVKELQNMNITPRMAKNESWRRGAIDKRTARHAGYRFSQRRRKKIEEVFGWMKTVGLLDKDKLHHRGLERVEWIFSFTAAAYNLGACVTSCGGLPERSLGEHRPKIFRCGIRSQQGPR